MSEVYIMNNFRHLKNVLNYNIRKMSECSSIFCENPDKDFTRDRILTFEKTVRNVICMGTGSLKDELLQLHFHSTETPTASAFIQARDKIKVEAFKLLFDRFNDKTHIDKLYKGYRLLAIDGSELPIDNTILDKETTLIKKNKIKNMSYCAYHITASYDLVENTYDDLIIQGEAEMDENMAFIQLVDRYKGKKSIFIADRYFESYNGFEHVAHSGNKYLIRVKDIDSKTSMTRSFGPYPQGEFDIDVCRVLTLKQNKMIKACPHFYRFFPKNVHFDYMNKENPFYEFKSRVVRFKITEDTYECIMTNLDRNEFSIEDIKELYNKRWGIETSFRELKYAIGLNALHSKKRKLIRQEIYAKVLLYNFCQRIIQEVKIPKNEKRVHKYQINFTRAFHILREFLTKKGGINPPVEDLIAKEILPIRPGRSSTRNVQSKKFVCFNYRYD